MRPMAVSTITSLLLAVVMNCAVDTLEVSSAGAAARLGLTAALLSTAAAAPNYAWAQRGCPAFLIECGHNTVQLVLITLIVFKY